MSEEAVRDAINKLKEISKVKKAEFLSNWKLHNSALWLLYTAIQGCIDIAMHVISSKTLRTPESYSDAFYVLAEAGIINPSEAEEFADMARFRNVLAHTYARVNLEIHIQNPTGKARQHRETLQKTPERTRQIDPRASMLLKNYL